MYPAEAKVLMYFWALFVPAFAVALSLSLIRHGRKDLLGNKRLAGTTAIICGCSILFTVVCCGISLLNHVLRTNQL